LSALLPIAKDDPDYQPWIGAFRQALQQLGWSEGRNVRSLCRRISNRRPTR
jgi:hypothetical protein